MAIPSPLTPGQLRRLCDPAQFQFETTADLPVLETIIGQERAVESIRFGVGIQHNGFNLFALGPNGIGKFTAVQQYLQQKAAQQPTPDDWCYIFNFEQPHKPHALNLPAGHAAQLRADMQQLVEDLGTVLPSAFSSDEYQKQKKAIEEEFKQREIHALDDLKAKSQENNIAFIRTPSGFAFAPLKNREVISPEEFMKLSATEQKEIETQIQELQDGLQGIMSQLPHWQRELQKQLKDLNANVAIFTITPMFNELRQKYGDMDAVLVYLTAVQNDIVKTVDDFLGSEESPLASMMGGRDKENSPQRFSRYQVNVIVDNSQTSGAPVVYEDQPAYNNLIGRAEHVSQMGTLFTDFTLIKPGILHRANGGYLMLDARKVLLQPYAWEGLKHALRAQEIRLESLAQSISLISTVSLEPEPIPLDVKVVLMGDRELYYLLHQYDPDFAELFKVAADFEDEMVRDDASNHSYAQLIGTLARKEALRHFDKEAVALVIEHGARLAGDASKLSTHMQSVSDLLREASYWAEEAQREIVTRADVQHSLEAQLYRNGRIRERIQEAILEDTILIDTQGAVVGQINGLAVYMLGTYSFGRPSRITARVRLGKGEVIDIERQVEMGGPIHSKGVLILASFLGARYAAERPLSLTASLVFEQSYSGVDGDSASSAELYALLSALSGAPIHQSLAVTGSVNQYGQVQAIGGVNEKIEGFYDLCHASGLTGSQGVLIPAANVKHLMLRQDVVDAVSNGRFHIYPINHIDEGIELLTSIPAGELDETGTYPAESINGRVISHLDKLAEKQRAFASPPTEVSQQKQEESKKP
ncbi:MAG: AAA family ATPase [Chloroflexi bacterium]|nr:AAA family ATPase [Chloroflexota bacterium]MBP7041871.1 AAA family ATPase [Chloroflexota bacterium]